MFLCVMQSVCCCVFFHMLLYVTKSLCLVCVENLCVAVCFCVLSQSVCCCVFFHKLLCVAQICMLLCVTAVCWHMLLCVAKSVCCCVQDTKCSKFPDVLKPLRGGPGPGTPPCEHPRLQLAMLESRLVARDQLLVAVSPARALWL